MNFLAPNRGKPRNLYPGTATETEPRFSAGSLRRNEDHTVKFLAEDIPFFGRLCRQVGSCFPPSFFALDVASLG